MEKNFTSAKFGQKTTPNRKCKSLCCTKAGMGVGGLAGYDVMEADNLRCLSFDFPKNKQDIVVECLRNVGAYYYLLKRAGLKRLFEKAMLKGQISTVVKEWSHEDTVQDYNQFAIYSDFIYVANRSSHCITCYSSNLGQRVDTDISIELAASPTYMCVTLTGLLILSQTTPSLLACIDTMTGTTVWSRKNYVNNPRFMTMDFKTNNLLLCAEKEKDGKPLITVIEPAFGKFLMRAIKDSHFLHNLFFVLND